MMRLLERCALALLLSALWTGCGSPSGPKTPANRAPTAVNPGPQTGLTGEWASLEISARDPDGDILSFSATGLPAGISMVSGTGRISGVYTAAGNYSVAVTVSDGNASARVAFAWVVTAPPNRPPAARAQTVFVDYDSAQTIALSGDDPDGDPLLYSVVAGPASGVLTGTPPELTYAPNPGFCGTDRLRFTVRDGEYEGEPAEVTIVVRPEGVQSPNILLVLLDDVGMDTTAAMHPGLIESLTAQYGPAGHNHPYYRRIAGRPASTPTLDTLARQGIAFTRTWVQPYCSPTRASILTGLSAARTRVLDYTDPLSATHETFVRILRDEAGYSTALFGKWHLAGLGYYPGMKPKQAGFDLFLGNLSGAIDNYWSYDYQVQDDATPPYQWRTEPAPARSLPGIGPTTYAPVVKAADAIDWITAREQADPNKPWFAWLAFNLSHIAAAAPATIVPDYDTLDETTREEIVSCGGVFGTGEIGTCPAAALNRAMTNSLDTVLGKLLEAVDALDPFTYVIAIGDNGTPMYGQSALNFIDNMYITRAGRAKGTAYESGVRVSLAMRGPGIAAGSGNAAAVHGLDLFATILDLAGARVPATVPNGRGDGYVPPDSVSLVPILFGGAAAVRHPDQGAVISEAVNPLAGDTRQAAAKNAVYKLLCTEGTQTAHCSFYDLVDDPLEEYPLPKPSSCLAFSNGTWTPADREWHFCSLQQELATRSFLGAP